MGGKGRLEWEPEGSGPCPNSGIPCVKLGGPSLPEPSMSPSVHWAHLRCFPRFLVILATSLQGSAEAGPRVTVGSPDPAHSPFGLDLLKAHAGVKGRGLGDWQSCSQILALPFT